MGGAKAMTLSARLVISARAASAPGAALCASFSLAQKSAGSTPAQTCSGTMKVSITPWTKELLGFFRRLGDLDRLVVHDLDVGGRAGRRGIERVGGAALGVGQADGELHVLGGDRLAVGPLAVRAELDGDRGLVGSDLPALRDTRVELVRVGQVVLGPPEPLGVVPQERVALGVVRVDRRVRVEARLESVDRRVETASIARRSRLPPPPHAVAEARASNTATTASRFMNSPGSLARSGRRGCPDTTVTRRPESINSKGCDSYVTFLHVPSVDARHRGIPALEGDRGHHADGGARPNPVRRPVSAAFNFLRSGPRAATRELMLTRFWRATTGRRPSVDRAGGDTDRPPSLWRDGGRSCR